MQPNETSQSSCEPKSQFVAEAFTADATAKTKKFLQSGKTWQGGDADDPLVNKIFGVGHIVLIALTFLPWVKTGMQTYNPYVFAKSMLDQGMEGTRPDLIFLGVVTLLIMAVIISLNAYGAFARFAKLRSFNYGCIGTFAACVVFLLTIFAAQMLLPKVGTGGYAFQITMGFEIGFFLDIAAAALLSALGSGKIDIQKWLSGSKANQ